MTILIVNAYLFCIFCNLIYDLSSWWLLIVFKIVLAEFLSYLLKRIFFLRLGRARAKRYGSLAAKPRVASCFALINISLEKRNAYALVCHGVDNLGYYKRLYLFIYFPPFNNEFATTKFWILVPRIQCLVTGTFSLVL